MSLMYVNWLPSNKKNVHDRQKLHITIAQTGIDKNIFFHGIVVNCKSIINIYWIIYVNNYW